MGSSFLEILHHATTRKLLGFDAVHAEKTSFVYGITSRLKFLLNDATQQLSLLKIGYTALEAFLQANCTGPPLDFNPEECIFPEMYRDEGLLSLKEELFQYLSVDGSRPYPLTPYIELFWLAKVIMANPMLAEAGFNGRRGRLRVNFWHQKLLSEESPSLREAIYADADVLEQQLGNRHAFGGAAAEEHFVEFLIERAVIRTHYGDDVLARKDLARAATTRQFQFVLTGALGKRTKFQDRDISQLVVLAKSRDVEPEPYTTRKGSRVSMTSRKGSEDVETPRSKSPSRKPLPLMSLTPLNDSPASTPVRPSTPAGAIGQEDTAILEVNEPTTRPDNVPLNDDTLLERIRFKTTLAPISEDTMTHVVSPESSLPPQLAALDPSSQPLLFPVDSIILLATASSISNTSPDDGLVREETLPYATRVLEGGSSNWQVYTQALLVRSRIEGYRTRTVERGLLQLQALVDQVIAETSETGAPDSSNDGEGAEAQTSTSTSTPSTFLPKPKGSESASASERLRYIYQLSSPLRWELEAELAARWTHMGGLKTALEIYERLQMHAEVALCLAATDREAEAVKLLKELLFEDVPGKQPEEADSSSKLRSPPPADSPRLLCILGDITGLPVYYTLAWTASSNRYARAQRSLGRHYSKKRDFQAAAEAYSQALNISRLDRASWFAFGCVQLELGEWKGATESFTRCVQLEDHDAEAWSNLAVALLKLPAPVTKAAGESASPAAAPAAPLDDEEPTDPTQAKPQSSSSLSDDPYRHIREALGALRRAATLKRDDARIWDNYLTVAASIPPSAGTPWGEIIQAMGRVIELRGKKEGERSVDLAILKVLTEYVLAEWVYPTTDSSTEAAEEEGVEKVKVSAEEEGANDDESPTTATTTKKLPYLPRSFLSLIDTSIAPLATSSAPLYELLSQISLWRHRPSQSLLYAEKTWMAHLNAAATSSPSSSSAATGTGTETFDDLSPAMWKGVVDKTIWLMKQYATLGPMQRERTGGEVEAKWAFKARSAGRKVLGRGKAWAEIGDESWARLKGEIDAL